MARVPGHPDKKLALLSNLDYKSLPHLVGDILYFQRRHEQVQVVDGPGDGKRDIHSLQPDGLRHITQCKYHQDFNTTVSSDETDQLVLALTKFGCKSGLFVTTGRISPQAKREYLDNYPNFKLDFMDGVGIVDSVLASPILSSVWFNGASIINVRNSLRIPFLLRFANTDKPLTTEHFSNCVTSDCEYKFSFTNCSRLDFEPYRPPSELTKDENGSDWIHCYQVLSTGSTNIHEIPDQIKAVTQIVAQQINKSSLPVIIRFGFPSLLSNITSRYDDQVKIAQVRPQSFIIGIDRSITSEKDWIVFPNLNDWCFPENLSVAEASWAGWLNRSENIILMQSLTLPKLNENSFLKQQESKIQRELLSNSLFLAGTSGICNSFKKRLSIKDKPNWSCPYGPNGILLGWLHPKLTTDYSNQEIDKQKEQKHKNLVNKIKEKYIKTSLLEVPSEQAIFIAAAAGEELSPKSKESVTFDSADLFHNFHDIPSPVCLLDRDFTLVQMWDTRQTLDSIRTTLIQNPLELDKGVALFWDAKFGRKTQKPFLLTSLTFSCPPYTSVADYFASNQPKVNFYLRKVHEYVNSHWNSVELSTVFFWRTEVGFQITDQVFRGNPWVILQRKGEKPTVIFHTPLDSPG